MVYCKRYSKEYITLSLTHKDLQDKPHHTIETYTLLMTGLYKHSNTYHNTEKNTPATLPLPCMDFQNTHLQIIETYCL